MDKYLDKALTPEERAEDLLGKLSIEEKVYQCSGLWAQSVDLPGQSDFGIGQVSVLEMRVKKTLKECADWQIEIQKKIMERSPHHIPAAFHMEGLTGAFLQGAMSFPSNLNRGSSFNPDLEEKIGAIVSRQEQAVGITQVLAPVLDVTQDPRMGREGETYGEDPVVCGIMGAAYTKGVQNTSTKEGEVSRQADACAKHFLGFHKSTGGIHGADVSVSERELIEKFGKPFQIAIRESNLRGVMPCYCTMGGFSASSNKKMLTEILRTQFGFEGQVLADYGAIANQHRFQGLFESTDEAGYAAMRAGMDVELPMREAFNDDMIQKFKSGEYDLQYLDRACRQSLTARFRMGLFENPFAYSSEERKKLYEVHLEEDRAVSLQSAREGLVLLKNDGVLPLSKTDTGLLAYSLQNANQSKPEKNVRKIAVIGPHAGNARFFFGGYTHLSMAEATYAAVSAMAGVEIEALETEAGVQLIPGTTIQSDEIREMDELLKHQKPDCRSLFEELERRLPDTEIVYSKGYYIAGQDCSLHAEALEKMQGADLILFTLGGKHGSCSVSSMGEGVDGTDINLPYCQDALIEKASALGVPMVGVHFNGRPVSSDIADRYLNAMIEAWNPSEMGAAALVETILGENNPSGKMPVTTARHAGQLPLQYNLYKGSAWTQGDSIGFKDYADCSHRPRYEFGYGLSYTTFEYRNIRLDTDSVSADGTVKVFFDIENTGGIDGTEVVQLYGIDPYASMARPIKELIGFKRVQLRPGEKKTILAEISPSLLAFLDEDMNWRIEKGRIQIQVGSSSEDIRLEASFTVKNTVTIQGRNRSFCARMSVL